MAVALTYLKVYNMHFMFVDRWGNQGEVLLSKLAT